jgi:hypothetical protein
VLVASVLADTPQWVVDGKNYLGFGASLVAAFGLVWRYAIKPYFEFRENERKRDIAAAAAIRKGEITAALIPLQEQVRALQGDVNRVTDKSILLGDAVAGANRSIEELRAEQRSLHAAVRDHMQTEDELKRQQGSN